MQHRVRWRLAAGLLIAAALTTACGGDDSEETPDATSSPAAQTIDVVMQDIAYDQQTLTIASDQPVRLELENRGAIAHDFTIEQIEVDDVQMTGGMTSDEHAHNEDGPDLHLALDGGAAGTLEFAPSEAGTYEYFCTVPGHREAGMHGTLTVE